MKRAKPDYWVVRDEGRNYLISNKRGRSLWGPQLVEAWQFPTRELAHSAKTSSKFERIVAVRRKPIVKRRIAELVAKCKAAIDAHAHAARVGGHTILTIEMVLRLIDRAAAAEIRAHWEAP